MRKKGKPNIPGLEHFTGEIYASKCRDLNYYVYNEAIPKEVPKVKCSHKDCITLLNSYSQQSGQSMCSVHSKTELEQDYTIKDSLWECTHWDQHYLNGNWKRRRCRRKAEYRSIIGTTVVMTCPKHLKKRSNA